MKTRDSFRFFHYAPRPLIASRISKMAACLGLASLLALSGCSFIQVKLGLRVSLAKIPVAAIEPSLPKDPGIAPGEKNPMVVTVTATDGKVYVTAGKGKGKVQWKDLTVMPSVVTFKKGVLSLDRDPRVSDGKTGHVTITVPTHPGISAALDIPLRYDYPFVSNYSGSSGTSGMNGSDGQSGTNGSDGSMDPNNPSPGGNGTNGTDGTNGGDGGAGGDGPPVQIWVTLRSGAHPLLQAGIVTPGHKERFYLIDPNGGTLTVNNRGGAGGSGGKGGHGGSGGSGGSGIPSGTSGSNGSDGRDGWAGSDGNGGSITVTYDPQVEPYLNQLHLSNPGGPAPVWDEEPVAPLW